MTSVKLISVREKLSPEAKSLFPLQLTPFEHFMLLDDRAETPMTFCVQIVFRGRLNQVAFESAVAAALLRHPLLCCRIDADHGIPYWELFDVVDGSVTWLSSNELHLLDAPPRIDIQVENGLRVLAIAEAEESRVALQFHHACCDGQGARRFIVDLMTGYARACNDADSPAWDQLDLELLRRRDPFLGAGSSMEAATSTWEKLRGAYHFHVLTPQPLARGESNPNSKSVILRHAFSPETTSRLREHARVAGTSLNDVGLALLFLTLADWNRQDPRCHAGDRLRIMMPTDLRGTLDDDMPAANRMSFSFIVRRIGECTGLSELLPGVRAETQYIKRVRIGLDFLGGITFALKLPRLVEFAMRRKSCMATAVLTNLGDPTKRFRRRFPKQDGAPVVGDVLLDAIFGTPPIRPQTRAGFGLCMCAGKLCISMLADANTLGSGRQELFDSYLRRWMQFAAADCASADSSASDTTCSI